MSRHSDTLSGMSAEKAVPAHYVIAARAETDPQGRDRYAWTCSCRPYEKNQLAPSPGWALDDALKHLRQGDSWEMRPRLSRADAMAAYMEASAAMDDYLEASARTLMERGGD